MSTLTIVLTSAVVSAVVAGVFTLFSQYLERKSRVLENAADRKARFDELLLEKAIDMALDEKKTFLEVVKHTNQAGTLNPDILSVAQLHRYLRSLFEEDSLPSDLKLSLRRQFSEQKLRDPENAAYYDALLKSEEFKVEDDGSMDDIALR